MLKFIRALIQRRNTITMDMKSVYRRDVKRRGNGELLRMLADVSRCGVYCSERGSQVEAAFWCRAGIIKAELKRRRAIIRECDHPLFDYAQTVW